MQDNHLVVGSTFDKAHIALRVLVFSHKEGGGKDLEESMSKCKLEQE